MRWFDGTAFFEDHYEMEREANQDHFLLRFEKAEEEKIKLASGKNLEISTETKIYPGLLERLLSAPINSLAEELNDRVFNPAERAAVTYFLLVGGNTRVPYFVKRTHELMQDTDFISRRALLLPESYRQTAIAYGAVWASDASVQNASPYDLRVFAGDFELFHLPRNQSQEVNPRKRPYNLPAGGKMKVEIRTESSAGMKRVAVAQVVNPNTTSSRLELIVSVQNGKLDVKSKFQSPNSDQTAEPDDLLAYPL